MLKTTTNKTPMVFIEEVNCQLDEYIEGVGEKQLRLENINKHVDVCLSTFQICFPKKSKYIFREYVRQYLHCSVLPPNTPYKPNWTTSEEHILQMLKTPQLVQRSPEWFKFRTERITASDIGTVLGYNRYGKCDDIIKKKCGIRDVFRTGTACYHGIKYEEVACMLYEQDTQKKVYEFGCVSHRYYTFIGASPDGIGSDGIMLEIKCPFSREIQGIPPKYYWAQMQIQMEVFDLWHCDYLECKFYEYLDYDEYKEDKDVHRKGVMLEYFTADDIQTPKYHYCPLDEPDPQNWLVDRHAEFAKLKNGVYEPTVYWWKAEVYSCVRIERDTEWFSEALPVLASFWDTVLMYRRERLYETFQKQQKEKEKKDVCLLMLSEEEDEDEEEEEKNR